MTHACHSPVHKLCAVSVTSLSLTCPQTLCCGHHTPVTHLSTNSVLWASQACHSPVHKLCAVGVTSLSLTCPQTLCCGRHKPVTHLSTNSVLWASQACSILVNSSSILSTIVSTQPRTWYGASCHTPTPRVTPAASPQVTLRSPHVTPGQTQTGHNHDWNYIKRGIA